ncbi:hypothetical protein Angca_003541, partial [Angiostrongylus cantonensis]
QQRPALMNKKGPVLLHDNHRPHAARPALQELNELGYETLPHAPYSRVFVPTDCHFFKHLDNILRKKCFTNHDDMKNAFSEFMAFKTSEFWATGITKVVSR